jgi:hypothetical protein
MAFSSLLSFLIVPIFLFLSLSLSLLGGADRAHVAP